MLYSNISNLLISPMYASHEGEVVTVIAGNCSLRILRYTHLIIFFGYNSVQN